MDCYQGVEGDPLLEARELGRVRGTLDIRNRSNSKAFIMSYFGNQARDILIVNDDQN